MKKTIIFFLFIFLNFTFSFSSSSLNITFPQKVNLGEILKVKIQDNNFSKVRIAFNTEIFTPYKLANFYICYIGIKANVKPENYKLKVFIQPKDSIKFSETFQVEVQKVNFPSQHLKFSQKKLSLYTNPKVEEEYKIIGAAIKEQIPEKYFEEIFLLPVEGRISTFYGTQRYYNEEKGSYHKGLDIAAKEGTPVKSCASGKVLVSKTFLLHGNTIVINHGLGIVSLYIHLQKRFKNEGDFVKQGEVIGLVGQTGAATGPHLHYGLYANANAINPLVNFK